MARRGNDWQGYDPQTSANIITGSIPCPNKHQIPHYYTALGVIPCAGASIVINSAYIPG